MNKVIVAFDIDGTLRCNCTDTCRDVNMGTLETAVAMNRLKNTTLIAWSGGGKQYTQSFIDSNVTLRELFGERCYSKIAYIQQFGAPDMAFDDEHAFALAKINLIVRNK
jgi:hypothetical protein